MGARREDPFAEVTDTEGNVRWDVAGTGDSSDTGRPGRLKHRGGDGGDHSHRSARKLPVSGKVQSGNSLACAHLGNFRRSFMLNNRCSTP